MNLSGRKFIVLRNSLNRKTVISVDLILKATQEIGGCCHFMMQLLAGLRFMP